MTQKQGHVDAIFGGEDVRFRVQRERAAFTAMALFGFKQPYALLQKFALGTWEVKDISDVLTVAYADGTHANPLVPPEAVTRVLNSEPPGVYAPLAVLILEAYIFGIDPERGVFDERPKDEAAA